MASYKRKQLLRILKSQALVVNGKDIDKIDAIFQCWGIFCKFECSCKDCVKAFNFSVQIKKDVNTSKNLKK